MDQHRKAYLVSKSLKQYLFASIISMAVANLNTMIDGILMGNFLGPDALAAINLCLPVINAILALATLLYNGAVMIAARAIGQMDRDRLNEVFTLSSAAEWVLGLLLLCLARPLSGTLASLICSGSELKPLCEKYIYVLLLGSVTLMYSNAFSAFLDVCGHPKAVTVMISLSVVVNILMDVVLVRLLGSDIGGAAWATVAGNSVSVIGLVLFTLRKKGLLKLRLSIRKPFSKLGEIIAKSVAQVIGLIAVTVLQLVCNFFIQNAQGTDGMFVLSIGYSILGISSMVGSGMSTAFTALGGSMMGQKDYQGLRILFRKGMTVCLLTGVGFMLISLLIPSPLAALFGADTAELKALATRCIPLISTFILAITLAIPFSTHFQVLGRFTLSAVTNLSIIISVLTGCLLVSALFPPEQIWLAFPLACILCLLTLLIGAGAVKLTAGKKATFPDLIPAGEPEVKRFDLSVACTEAAFEESMRELWDYLLESGYGKLSGRIAHSVEELLLNTVQHSGGNSSHYIDVLIRGNDREVTALLKDDGMPFNTAVCLTGNKTNGLNMAHHFCPSIEYSYSFGQNMTMMKWPRE